MSWGEPHGGAPGAVAPVDLDQLLAHAARAGASDLHLTVGAPPTMRIRGSMVPVPDQQPLESRQLRESIYAILTEAQRKVLEEERELDFAHSAHGVGRFRVNVFWQRDSVGAVLRMIPWEIKRLEDLGMPPVLGTMANLKRGLVLVTGPTGSGKSTTLAAIIDQVNRTRRGHIMTIEDPIEFLHQHHGCLVNQREVGVDTHDFRSALKHVLRQDPDVILVGELRDLDTISVAISAAETGHLVFATLHTQSAQDTVSRVVDVFPANQQQQVRTQLAATLQAVVCQSLVPSVDGRGRVPAVEVMMCTEGIRAMIRDDKLQQIPGALQAGGRQGMQTLNAHLAEHVKSGRISQDTGLEYCSNIGDFITLLGGGSRAATEAASLAATQSPSSFGTSRPDPSDPWRVASTPGVGT
ncbi:type IV pilus twitching motility protein PilT [Nocardioides dongxiaopingii]|uniref:type IV pilus twitching motility protein PilT n=1 Tax=Nocardioides sp. S-1144 TaxID=2582905 RepID=UPI001652B243|nr:type IV pilus twitching motility protein PilT [Nocardioides sp. S-1144]